MSRAIAPRLACLAAAAAIAVPLAVGPIAAAPVAAAGPRLDLVGTTRYIVQPGRHRVHVTVDLVATNRSVETITTRYVYDHANLAVLPGAVGFHASNDGLKVTSSIVARTPSSTLVAIRFAKRLGSGRSTTLRLTFDLPDPGGSPSRQIRVGPSLVAFPVWAFGSRGVAGSSVSVTVPAGYKVTVGAGRLSRPTIEADGTTSLTTGSLADPFALSGYVLADRAGAFAETPLNIPVDGGTAHLVLRAWTDDPAWARKTATLLKRAIPALSKSIGLPYRPTAPIAIEETVARSIDGRSGVYEPAADTIRIAYTAPPSVVIRSVAHLWFDESLFADRWIVEGLVSQATAKAALRLDLQSDEPTSGPTAADAFPLNAWVADPGRGPEAEASEAYGYAASAELVRLIAARTGADGLRAVLGAAIDRSSSQPVDWRGLLDLLEQQAGVDATDLWRTWVARPEDAALLDARALARFQDAELVRDADGWALPPSIDADLAAWRFDDAEAAMTQARAVLDARDELAVAAAVAGLELPPNLRAAFEDGDAEAAAAEARIERAIVDQIVAAEQAGAATSSSPLVAVGLLGQEPMAQLAAARSAFSAGDLSAAQAKAIGAREAWAGASDLGGLRLRASIALGLIAGLLALLVSARLRRPRRRERKWFETGAR